MSAQFEQIIARVLGKTPKGEAQKALWKETIAAKATALKGTMEVRSEDFMSDRTLEGIDESVNLQVEDIMLGMLSQDIFDKPSEKIIRSSGKLNIEAVYGLKDRTNTPISALNLTRLMNATLHDHVKLLMGKQGRLKYQTGRFANSVQVNGMKFSSKIAENRHVSVFFNYMIAPYAVFGKEGKRYSASRDPVPLIRKAILASFRKALNKASYKQIQGRVTTEERNL